MVSSTSGLFFRTLAELSISQFLSKIVSTTRRNRRLSTMPIAGIVMLSTLIKVDHTSAVPDQSSSTGHNILASGQCDLHCKIRETLLIQDLKSALNENVGSKKACGSKKLFLTLLIQTGCSFRLLLIVV